jgi:glycosyltransferase involved in cell wall biosynthesis
LSDKFIFAGYRRDIAEILALTDIFVLPTMFEGLPHSVLEAMAAGCCVVASRVDGVAEVVEDGETGILVEAANVEQLIAALNPLIDDAEARGRMGRKGKIKVKEGFGLGRMVEGVDSLYTAAWFARSSQRLS